MKQVIVPIEVINKMIADDYARAEKLNDIRKISPSDFDNTLFQRLHGGINRLETLRHYYTKED